MGMVKVRDMGMVMVMVIGMVRVMVMVIGMVRVIGMVKVMVMVNKLGMKKPDIRIIAGTWAGSWSESG